MQVPGKELNLGTRLGKGGYGSVYVAYDKNKQKYAVKSMVIRKRSGIPCLMECSIMSSIIHPFLNPALEIYSSSNHIYIVQELAQSDLSQITRKNKQFTPIAPTTLKQYLFSVVQALACLHSQGILHLDVKASNVLLMRDGIVKLTDFSLSARNEWNRSRGSPGTQTHRSPEIWLGKGYSYPSDIWSLGVTFYEIAYGDFIFPYQGKLSKEHSRERCLNCIIDWAKRKPQPETVKYEPTPFRFIPFSLNIEYINGDPSLNELIVSMLSFDPKRRPTIYEISNHRYFRGMATTHYSLVSTPEEELSSTEIRKMEVFVEEYTHDPYVAQVALELYSRCHGVKQKNKFKVILLIAHKIVKHNPPPRMRIDDELIKGERIICDHLKFRLHYTTK